MEATILGCGEACDELLPNTSVLLRAGGTVLFDCGFSVPAQVWRAVSSPDEIAVLSISHAHADHYFGVPALLARMFEEGRTRPLVVLGLAAVLEQVRIAVEMGYPGLAARFAFPVEYRPVEPGRTETAAGIEFDFAPSRHAVPNLAVRASAGGKRFCYSGDGMFTAESRALFSGADLLVHEAYFFEQSPNHADIGAVTALAAEADVKRTALVHVSRKLRREPARIEETIAAAGAQVEMPEPTRRYEL